MLRLAGNFQTKLKTSSESDGAFCIVFDCFGGGGMAGECGGTPGRPEKSNLFNIQKFLAS